MTALSIIGGAVVSATIIIGAIQIAKHLTAQKGKRK